MFYVYEWYVKDTNEIFYVGKGSRKRYKVRKHNKFFNDFIKRFNCDSRIIKTFDDEESAFSYEYERVKELKNVGQCVCNIYDGGFGGTKSSWTEDKRKLYSTRNIMKSEYQRKRMSEKNPMKDSKIATIVGIKHRKAVTVDGKYFDSVKEAARYIGTHDRYLTSCLKNRSGLCKGYRCEYANQQPSQANIE